MSTNQGFLSSPKHQPQHQRETGIWVGRECQRKKQTDREASMVLQLQDIQLGIVVKGAMASSKTPVYHINSLYDCLMLYLTRDKRLVRSKPGCFCFEDALSSLFHFSYFTLLHNQRYYCFCDCYAFVHNQEMVILMLHLHFSGRAWKLPQSSQTPNFV